MTLWSMARSLLQLGARTNSEFKNSEGALKRRKYALVCFREPEDARHATASPIRVALEGGSKVVLHAKPFRVPDGATQRAKFESKVFAIHERKVLANRGSPWLPYCYDGKRAPGEVEVGTQLNRNHSHYVLVDDGTEGAASWGKEIQLRAELTDFISFRHDAVTTSMDHLTRRIRERDPADTRAVPVIALVYGGGPGTFATILGHIRTNDPILVVKGSGRAAGLICDWQALQAEVGELRGRAMDPGSLLVRVRVRGVVERQLAAARAWLVDLGGTSTPEQEEKLEAEIVKLQEKMNTIVGYKQLHIFDFFSSKQSRSAQKGSHHDSKHENALLPVVLNAIFNSEQVDASVKLPLAVRYKDRYEVCTPPTHPHDASTRADDFAQLQVKGIMTRCGIQLDRPGTELSHDARPLLFAAAADDAGVPSHSEHVRHPLSGRCRGGEGAAECRL
jgi:hypothetical protein